MKVKINKKGQEEIVGFVLIIILVAVIFLFILGFSLRSEQKQTTKSSELDSFIQASLLYTTDCQSGREYLSIKDLIFKCNNRALCLDSRETCEVLNSTIEEILEESWKTGEERPVKGYEFQIIAEDETMLILNKGNKTKVNKAGLHNFAKGLDSLDIIFTVYY